jgi:hypothetical protein
MDTETIVTIIVSIVGYIGTVYTLPPKVAKWINILKPVADAINKLAETKAGLSSEKE